MNPIRYTAEPALKNPVVFLQSMARDLAAARELAWRLFLRDLRAKYRGSFLGYVWIVLPPAAVTLTLVFLQDAKLMNVGELSVPYALFVLCGTTLWQLFADAVQAPLKIIRQSRAMLVKINFPREALLIAAMLDCIVVFLIRLSLLLICFPFFDQSIQGTLTQWLFYLPIAVCGLVLCGLALGTLIAPIGILMQDISQGLPLLMSFWYIVTPIAYPKENAAGLIAVFNRINPVTALIEVPRSILLGLHGHSFETWSIIIITGLMLCLVAWCFFRIALPHVISRIGS